MQALVATALGAVIVDLDESVAELVDLEPPVAPQLELGLPLLVAADASGARVVAVVDRRPPILVSDDAGATWREAGGGLPPGSAVALDPDDVDRLLFASGDRLYLSETGGLFWRRLEVELPGVTALAFVPDREGVEA
jgi:hypothetical protein